MLFITHPAIFTITGSNMDLLSTLFVIFLGIFTCHFVNLIGLGPQLFFHYLPYKDLLGKKTLTTLQSTHTFFCLCHHFLLSNLSTLHMTVTSSFSCCRPLKLNTGQFIPVTAHVGSRLRGVLRFTCFPEIKKKQNKNLIFKTPTCWSINRITVK